MPHLLHLAPDKRFKINSRFSSNTKSQEYNVTYLTNIHNTPLQSPIKLTTISHATGKNSCQYTHAHTDTDKQRHRDTVTLLATKKYYNYLR